METSASFEARYAPLLYPANQSRGLRVPDRTMVAKFDRRSALLVSEQTGFVANRR